MPVVASDAIPVAHATSVCAVSRSVYTRRRVLAVRVAKDGRKALLELLAERAGSALGQLPDGGSTSPYVLAAAADDRGTPWGAQCLVVQAVERWRKAPVLGWLREQGLSVGSVGRWRRRWGGRQAAGGGGKVEQNSFGAARQSKNAKGLRMRAVSWASRSPRRYAGNSGKGNLRGAGCGCMRGGRACPGLRR